MSTTGTITHRLVLTGTNRTDVQVSKNPWNDSLVAAGGATGALLMRDTGKTDGWGWLDAVATGQVLCSGGVGTAPAWSASPAVTSVVIGGVTIDATDAGKIDGITNGTAAASKALVLDANLDISGIRNLTVTGSYFLPNSAFLSSASWGDLSFSADGKILVRNGAGNSFNMLLFGGTTSSFPALKRSSAELQARLADDSNYAVFRAHTLISEGDVNAVSLEIGANYATTGGVRLPNNSGIYARDAANTTNKQLVVLNSSDEVEIGDSGAGRLHSPSGFMSFAGKTSSFPALKRAANDIEIRLADDSGYADLLAATFTATGQIVYLNSAGSRFIQMASGSPEGAVTASVGALYLRSDGGAGTTLYIKESGTGNTGWVAK